MAEHLASIFGTEKDRVNCPFYFKIGACRHGDRCSRLHNRPTISPTLVLVNMYQRPDMITPGVNAQGQPIDPRKMQEHFEDFYEDIFEELSKFGEIENLNVCDNLADHMIGNVYVQFREEDQAAAAHTALQGRFYSGRPIVVDFSPVTDFREATCRQYEENSCNRGGYCNFMHVKKIGRDLRKSSLGVTGGCNGEEAEALAQFTGGNVVTEMITVVAAVVAVMITMVVVVVAMVATMVVVVVAMVATMVVVGARVEAAGMKGTTMEGGAGMVAVLLLPDVQEARAGRTARSAGLRLSSGTVKGRKSNAEPPFKVGEVVAYIVSYSLRPKI
ncbi:unnamed protein product [Urochloa humidicola]